MRCIELDLEAMDENEIRARLREFNFELPLGFDFKQHLSLTFDTELRKVVAVVKKG